MPANLQDHWQRRYRETAEDVLSWYEAEPQMSLGLIRKLGEGPASSLIDIGGGASHLVDALLQAGWRDVAVLDLSDAAMSMARDRLGELAEDVTWIAADVTQWQPERAYDIWHDRAAFHFLTEEKDRAAYAERLKRALKPGGYAIIATFAPDGPERCSGLPVVRYDSPALMKALGAGLSLIDSLPHEHRTPSGARQSFVFHVLQR